MPLLLQLSASEKSATICLLSTDNCHWNVRLQTAVTFIAASLTCKCSKETNRSDSKWLLALLGNAVKQQEPGRLRRSTSRGLPLLSSLKDFLPVLLLAGKSLEKFLWSTSSWVEFQIQTFGFEQLLMSSWCSATIQINTGLKLSLSLTNTNWLLMNRRVHRGWEGGTHLLRLLPDYPNSSLGFKSKRNNGLCASALLQNSQCFCLTARARICT